LIGILGLASLVEGDSNISLNLVRPATVRVEDTNDPSRTHLERAWWNLPDQRYWEYVSYGLLLAIGGIFATRKGGRSPVVWFGFGLNLALLCLGLVLLYLAEKPRLP
jgi:hypothetical protein